MNAAQSAPSSISPASHSGWLLKSHKGGEATSERRFFVSEGAVVSYGRMIGSIFAPTGKVDLQTCTAMSEPEPGTVVIQVSGKQHPLRVALGPDSEKWRTLWASAVSETALDAALLRWRDASLAARLDKGSRKPSSRPRLVLAKSGSRVAPKTSDATALKSARGAAPKTSGREHWSESAYRVPKLSMDDGAQTSGGDLTSRTDVDDTERNVAAPRAGGGEAGGGEPTEAELEAARAEWLSYFLKAELFQNALLLAVSEEEERGIREAMFAVYEPRRLQWLQYHTARGNYDEAIELVADQAEREELAARRRAAEQSSVWTRCCVAAQPRERKTEGSSCSADCLARRV